MSLFISFEGGEGSGKSTQAALLRDRLQSAGAKALLVQEPGTTPLGQYLRGWLKREKPKDEDVSTRAELLLFAAARAELATKVIRPALTGDDTVVISDRYADSTIAYQGYGRRLSLKDVEVVNHLATTGTLPDLTFLLDLPPDEGLDRVGPAQSKLPLQPSFTTNTGRGDEEGSRRFEEESIVFQDRVRNGYLELARNEPERWRVIDATKSVESVSDDVWGHVEKLLPHASEGGALALEQRLPLLGDES